MSHLEESELEALAFREPLPTWATASAHAGACEDCGARLAGLQDEHAALSRFVDGSDAPEGGMAQLWQGIEQRIAGGAAPARAATPLSSGSRRRWAIAASLTGALAAAAALLIALRPTPSAETEVELDVPTASARAALERAEGEYRHAAKVIEAEVAARGPAARGRAAPGGAALAHARRSLGAEPDARSRVRLLGGYAAYLKSLRRALDEPPGEQR